MSDGSPETAPDPRGLAGVLVALDVRRQAVRGFGVGFALAAFLYVFFVFVPGSTRPWFLYLALAFVVAVTAGLLFTAVLVVVAAVRRTPGEQ